MRDRRLARIDAIEGRAKAAIKGFSMQPGFPIFRPLLSA